MNYKDVSKYPENNGNPGPQHDYQNINDMKKPSKPSSMFLSKVKGCQDVIISEDKVVPV